MMVIDRVQIATKIVRREIISINIQYYIIVTKDMYIVYWFKAQVLSFLKFSSHFSIMILQWKS